MQAFPMVWRLNPRHRRWLLLGNAPGQFAADDLEAVADLGVAEPACMVGGR
jgi:hypothetical protein